MNATNVREVKEKKFPHIPLSGRAEEYVKLAWWVWGRFFPRSIKEKIGEMGLLPDLRQEIALIAWEGYLPEMDKKNFLALAQRRLYSFLTAYGFRKPKGSRDYIRREESYPVFYGVCFGKREFPD